MTGDGLVVVETLIGELTAVSEVRSVLASLVGKDGRGEERCLFLRGGETLQRLGGANAALIEAYDIEAAPKLLADGVAEPEIQQELQAGAGPPKLTNTVPMRFAWSLAGTLANTS